MSGRAPAPLYQRLLWMLAIWTLSVCALGLVAFAIRFVIRP
jgi:hypothetical protein